MTEHLAGGDAVFVQAATTLDHDDFCAALREWERLAASGTADVVDAHVAICARRAGQDVVTSDADDLCALDPALGVVSI